MNIKSLILLALALFIKTSAVETEVLEESSDDVPFVIVMAGNKHKDITEWNLRTILRQNYNKFRVVLIDIGRDESEDFEKMIKELDKDHRVTLFKENGADLPEYYQVIHACQKHEVVIMIENFQRLSDDDNLLDYLNTEYQDSDLWLTYGSISRHGFSGLKREVPDEIAYRHAYRDYPFIASHMITFYAGLFQLIDKKDLMYRTTFYKEAWELPVMFALQEMANWHTIFTEYNFFKDSHVIGSKIDAGLYHILSHYFRRQRRYRSIDDPFAGHNNGYINACIDQDQTLTD